MNEPKKSIEIVVESETKASILLAEDSPDARAMMKKSLEKQGYSVTAVENGKQCIEKFINLEFDIVVVDFVMPEKNGLEVLQEIRKRRSPEELPVIMITAKQKIALVKAAISQGVNDFFIKPIKTNEFVNRLEKHLVHLTDEELKEILLSLNIADASILSLEIQQNLQDQKMVAFPFEYRGIKCCAILDRGKNPHMLAKDVPQKISKGLTILAKGVFLWSIIWPRNATPRFELPKHVFNIDENFADLVDGEDED